MVGIENSYLVGMKPPDIMFPYAYFENNSIRCKLLIFNRWLFKFQCMGLLQVKEQINILVKGEQIYLPFLKFILLP